MYTYINTNVYVIYINIKAQIKEKYFLENPFI